MAHTTVLLHETVAAIHAERAATIIDCTYGAGGHSRAILERLAPDAVLLSIDADATAFIANPATDARHRTLKGNFKDIATLATQAGIATADAILADLGWRTEQFTTGERGFSFTVDEPLAMTYGDPTDYIFTAYDVVNEWEESNLADIIYTYGEERGSRAIAKAIVQARANAPIETSLQLAEIVRSAVGRFYRTSKLDPATKTFQAIRIAVNDELGALTQLLADGYALLAPGGYFAIITFHSLEDRLVKQTFRSFSHDYDALRITKKPITASVAELTENPRARSAKLRIIQKPL